MLHSDETWVAARISPSPRRPGSMSSTASLNGLFWGDNVVFAADDAADVEPFFRAVAAKAPLYEASAFVTLVREPAEIAQAYPGLELVDAREDGPLAQPRPLLDALAARCTGAPRQLLLFDSIEAMSERWGRETAGRFFSRGCPLSARARGDRLLVAACRPAHSGVAPRDRGNHAARARRRRQPVADSQGRRTPARRRGQRLPLRPRGRAPRPRGCAAAARLGAALRSLRTSRHLSQADLARLAGRLAERHLAGRARQARPLARDAPRPGREAEHHAGRSSRRRRRARISPRPPRRSAPRRDRQAGAAARRSPRRPARVPRSPLAGRLCDAGLRAQGRRGRQCRDRPRSGAPRLGRAGAPSG